MPALRSPSLTTSDAVLSTRVRAITGATATTYSLKRHHISKVGVMAAAYSRTYRSGARKERRMVGRLAKVRKDRKPARSNCWTSPPLGSNRARTGKPGRFMKATVER